MEAAGTWPHHIGECGNEEDGRPEPRQHVASPAEARRCPELLGHRLLGYVGREGAPTHIAQLQIGG